MSRGTLALMGLLAALGSTTTAQASSHRVPTPVAARTLTLPDATLRLDDGPYWPLPSGLVETTFLSEPDDTATRSNLGLALGLSRDFELGAHLLKLPIDPSGGLADPSVYALYRFVDGSFELGIFGELSVPIEAGASLIVGLPMAFHLGDALRFDTGPFVIHDFSDGPALPPGAPDVSPDNNPDLLIPFQLPISLSRLTLGPEAAIVLRDFEDEIFLLGAFLSYTLLSHGATLGDLGVRFRVPSTEVGLDVFTVMFELGFFFDL